MQKVDQGKEMTSLTEGHRYKYLFCDTHNGWYKTYKPFTINKRLTQDLVYELILETCPYADRAGGTLDHLRIATDKRDLDLRPYHSIYTIYEDNYSAALKGSLDPLPSDFKDWEILETVTGNY